MAALSAVVRAFAKVLTTVANAVMKYPCKNRHATVRGVHANVKTTPGSTNYQATKLTRHTTTR